MKKIILLIFIFSLLARSFAQLPANALPEWGKNYYTLPCKKPEEIGFGQLSFLQKLLKSNRILLLGEQTHREGSVSKTKLQLLKYLHEKMDYNLLLLEDNFFSLYLLNQTKQKNSIARQQELSFSTIYENQEFSALLDYIETCSKKGKPLKIYGFDSQIFKNNNQELIQALRTYLQQLDLQLTEEDCNFLNVQFSEVAGFPHEGDPIADLPAEKRLDDLLYNMKIALGKQKSPQNAFWFQIVQLTSHTFEMVKKERSGEKEAVQNFRDRMMAGNFKFLAQEFKTEKIIAWGASYHFANHLSDYVKDKITDDYVSAMREREKGEEGKFDYSILERGVPMGQLLKKEYTDQLYALAFTTSGGSYGLPDQPAEEVPAPPKESLEHALSMKGAGITWIHLKQSGDGSAFFASPLGHLPIKANWPNIYDGLFYLPRVEPLSSSNPKQLVPVLKLRGLLLDGKTGSPVPYANVGISSLNKNVTSSNENGQFEIPLAAFTDTDTLKVSAIGYTNKPFPLHRSITRNNKELLIRMVPSAILLNEVSISGPLKITPEIILKNVISALSKNYPRNEVFLELFFRYKKPPEQGGKKTEAFIDFYAPYGYKIKPYDLRSYSKEHLIRVKQVRSLGNGTPLQIPYLNMMFFDIVGGTVDLLQADKVRNYQLKMSPMSVYNGEPVYVLHFKDTLTRAIKAYNYIQHYSGTLYIKQKDYGVLKYEGLLERKLPLIHAGNTKESKDSILYIFDLKTNYRQINGTYHLDAGKITEWQNSKKDPSNSILEFLRTDIYKKLDLKGFKPIIEAGNLASPPFDPHFWELHPILIDD